MSIRSSITVVGVSRSMGGGPRYGNCGVLVLRNLCKRRWSPTQTMELSAIQSFMIIYLFGERRVATKVNFNMFSIGIVVGAT